MAHSDVNRYFWDRAWTPDDIGWSILTIVLVIVATLALMWESKHNGK